MKEFVKKFLIGTGVLMIVGLSYLAFILFSTHQEGQKLDKSSKEYVNEVVPKISTDWNEKKLRIRASDEFMGKTNDEELKNLFSYANAKLGKMKVYLGSQGESRIFISNFNKNITAVYTAEGEFERGKADINISLIRKNNKWYILGYNIQSNVFKQY